MTCPKDLTVANIVYMPISDTLADVWLRKNIHTEEIIIDNSEGEPITDTVNVADEVYFQVDASSVSESDIKNCFEKYWLYGENWTDKRNLSDSEKIKMLETENSALMKCVAELSELLG